MYRVVDLVVMRDAVGHTGLGEVGGCRGPCLLLLLLLAPVELVMWVVLLVVVTVVLVFDGQTCVQGHAASSAS